MKLSISNIAWSADRDDGMYELLRQKQIDGLEIAPTRILSERPYERLEEIGIWSDWLAAEYGLVIPSMQSIWYGRQENLFRSEKERKTLLHYTKQAVLFAERIHCSNLVFGCPRNRSILQGDTAESAVEFFRELGEFAWAHHTVIGMEANPPMYNTNYINRTEEALELIDQAASRGFRLNLDVGTMIANGESPELLRGKTYLVQHVHISEPGLKPIQKRQLHRDLICLLREEGYDRFVSVEMGKTEDMDLLSQILDYGKEIIS